MLLVPGVRLPRAALVPRPAHLRAASSPGTRGRRLSGRARRRRYRPDSESSLSRRAVMSPRGGRTRRVPAGGRAPDGEGPGASCLPAPRPPRGHLGAAHVLARGRAAAVSGRAPSFPAVPASLRARPGLSAPAGDG